jgi:hypothetical protein
MRKLMILLACGLAFGAASCGRAQTENPTNASDTTQQSPQERMRAFAECMRGQGIEMQDPEVVADGDGGTRSKVRVGPSGGPKGAAGPGPNDEAFKKAEQECRHLLPEGGDLGKSDPEAEERMREFAKCMRDNGVEGFPDPQPGRGIGISPEMGIDPEDPAFKAAEEKCGELMPRGKEKVTS